jgi:hypothetical protein
VPALEIKPLSYGRLKATSEEYDLAYWQELRALYEGGKTLLRHPEVFRRLFPRHANETDLVYEERCRRAYYVADFATIIDFIVAGLSGDPIRLLPPGADEAPAGTAPELDEFYEAFLEDCSPPGGKRQAFHELLKEAATTGLLLGRWWTLTDLPASDPTAPPPADEAEQRSRGLLDPYAVQVEPECVLDWDAEANGAINWAIMRSVSKRRRTPDEERDIVREEYRLYTAEGWALYVVEWSANPKREKPKPEDDAMIPVEAFGPHSFGRVPLVLHKLPIGLWAGNKLFSIAVEYLNKSCGLSWAEYKDLYQQLYEFLGQELPGIDREVSTKQEDPNRARRQPRGPGHVQERGQDDKAEYVGPDTTGMVHSAERLVRIREDMYRVTYQMALTQDQTGALAQRSEKSRKLDASATDIVQCAIGRELREHAVEVVDTAAVGRGDKPGYDAAGYEQFSSVDLTELIEQAMTIETISIPSATYQKTRKLRLVRADLGDEATPELMKKVESELEGAITQDQLQAAGDVAAGLADPVGEAAAERDAAAAEEAAKAAAKAPGAKPPGKKAVA